MRHPYSCHRQPAKFHFALLQAMGASGMSLPASKTSAEELDEFHTGSASASRAAIQPQTLELAARAERYDKALCLECSIQGLMRGDCRAKSGGSHS